jgi:hypothetical protein
MNSILNFNTNTMYEVEPLEGVIYLYRKKTGKNLYVGQSFCWNRRHRDHFKVGTKKTNADRKLIDIGEDNIDVIILHRKIFNDFNDEKDNRQAYQLWANELEVSEIEKHDTYRNGLNGTKGGQHDNNKDAFIEYNHKISVEFFEKFIKAAKIYNEKEQAILGACPRTYIIEEMNNYKLGEDLHKFRCNSYSTIWADKECVKLLNEVGYTRTSKEAGVNAKKRAGSARRDNKLPKILKILDWIHAKYDHVNITQGSENPEDFPVDLINEMNYTTISQLIHDLRRKGNKSFGNQRDFYLHKYSLFDSDEEFMNHKFTIGMEWYYENERFSWPQGSYIIPENSSLPRYMNLFTLGVLYSNRKATDNIPENVLELIEKNKDKPRPTQKDNWEKNPEKKEIMAEKCRKAMNSKSSLFYKIRSWLGILEQHFENLKITELKEKSKPNKNLSKAYLISQQNFSFESTGNNTYFTVSKYKSLNECYLKAREYKIEAFYARKWYIKTFIKSLQLKLENEDHATKEKPIKVSGQKTILNFNNNLSEFIKYFDLNKRKPSEHSDIVEEKRLGQWYRYQLSAYKKGKNYKFKSEFKNLLERI